MPARFSPLAVRAVAVSLLGLLLAISGCASTSAKPIIQPTGTAGPLRLTTDRQTYASEDPIGVTLTNTASQSFYAVDGYAACTFLRLQRYQPATRTWKDTSTCADQVPPHVVLVTPGLSEPFTLAPSSSADPNAWQPGTYRVAMAYSASADGTSALRWTYSPGFAITG